MPCQLLPLRLLTSSVSSTGLSTMKLTKTVQPPSAVSVFSRIFPFRLEYQGLSRPLEVPQHRNERLGLRKFSTGSFRARSSGRSSSAVGGFSGVQGGGQAAKSLIEDENELDNWISEIKKDRNDDDYNDDFSRGRGGRGGRDSAPSFRGGRGGRGGGGRDGRDSRDSAPYRSQRGGRDDFSASKRPRFNSESDDNDDFGRGSRDDFGRGNRGGRDSAPSFRGGRGGRDSTTSFRGGRDSTTSFRGGRGGRDSAPSFRSQRGGRDDFSSSKRPREDFDGRVSRNGNGSRGGRNEFTSLNRRRLSESEEDSDVELYPRRRGGLGGRGAGSSPARRGGRDSESSIGRSRGGASTQRGRKQPVLISDDSDDDDDDDEDEEGDSVSGFSNLLSEEDSEVDSEEDGEEDSEEDGEEDDHKGVDLLGGLAKEDNARPTPKVSTGESDSYLSGTRFDQCSVSPLSLKGIKDAGYERMTVVQEATLPVILKGKDVLAKAKTGTGKTVAFLLPAIEVIVKSPSIDRDQKRPPVFVLVICPTRELASQAAAEANTLLKFHPSIGVQVVIGGVRLALEQKRMQANPCQILVATPGRLRDHIENTPGFAPRLMGVKVLVLDEADHLLDMGFRKDIEKIIAAVPKQRQTLLFSATVPEEVRQICHIALKRDHEFINTVEEGSEETHEQVRQMHLVAPLEKHFSHLYVLLKEHIADDVDYKVLVFCTTAMVTRLVASLLAELNLNVREIHSRKPQSYRTRVSDEFRKSKGLILVTSDVSARGVDYPDVSLVLQVGLPSDREQYIHRLGRTGRKGKEGQGILLLAPWEEFFLRNLKDLPLTKAPEPSVDPDTRKKVERALSNVEMKNKEAAYQAWLGFYNSNKTVARDKCRLVELANEFSRSMGLDNPPVIAKNIISKMGLRNVPGLRSK